MAIPSSGPISLSDIQTEFGGSNPISLSEYYAGGAYVPSGTSGTYGTVPSSGTISIQNFYGTAKATRVSLNYTFSSTTANASLNLSSLSGYSAGLSDITITISSGVYLYATSTGNAGLTLTGGASGDTLTIVNNGHIMGMGGAAGGYTAASYDGSSGGPALSIPISATINNTNSSAYIGGGGGGGGATTIVTFGYSQFLGGGGGAGGGAGGTSYQTSNSWTGAGGAGGGVNSPGNNGVVGSTTFGQASGGGGGRIFPSVTITQTLSGNQSAGLGGTGGGTGGLAAPSGTVGMFSTGGGPGVAGSAYSPTSSGSACATGGGGGWGSSGGSSQINNVVNHTGGSGGNAVQLNGNSVTWVSGNTTRVYGAVA